MPDSLLQFVPALLAALAAGALPGWLLGARRARRQQEKISDQWELKFDETARQRDRLSGENIKLRETIEAQQALMARHEQAAQRSRTELESAREKIKAQEKDNFSLAAERDEYRKAAASSQEDLGEARQQIRELESEFVKAGDFYKGELEKALEKRKALELKIDDAVLEHDSVSNLLEASRSEHDSVKKMLASAQTRLANIDELEKNVIQLEADNAQLRHDATLARQEIDALRRDIAELDELKVQNKELAHCLTSMENSRKQYETDAKRYREQADQSEKRSETLLLKLDDVEKSFSDMARQHDAALKMVQQREAATAGNGQQDDPAEVDDLTQIVGIGKVFQQTLHKLGVFTFRQIAAFGPSDIARVNMELKEFKGRMEQDDWIGQAKELHFRKYGDSSTTH